MAEGITPKETTPRKRLTLAFIEASLGPLIIEQLAKDETCARVFSADICDKIRQYKEKTETQLVAPVMKAFLHKACPLVRNNQILNWVCTQYLSHRHNGKPILAEDLYKIGGNLTYFDQLKNSVTFKKSNADSDLLKYKTYADFESMLDPFLKRKAQKEILAEEFNMSPKERIQLLSETTFLYQGPEGKVVVPHTPTASQYWGSNTKWCISGKEYAETHFPSYNERSPVIMILPAGLSDKKIALVDKMLWDSTDSVIAGLPETHYLLMHKCLAELSEGTRKNIMQWIPDTVNRIIKGKIEEEPTLPWIQEIRQEYEKIENRHIQDLDEKLWSNKDFVLAIVQRNGMVIKYAAEKLRTDRSIALAAVQKDGFALEYLPKKLQADREIVLAAVQQHGLSIQHASEELRADRDIILASLKGALTTLDYVPEALRSDREISLAAVQKDGRSLQYLPDNLKSDREIIYAATQSYPQGLADILKQFQSDREIVLAVVQKDCKHFSYAASEFLKSDAGFIIECLAIQDDLAFSIKSMKDTHIWQPDDQALKEYQVKALERMIKKDEIEKFRKYARHFKSTWGDADILFAADPAATLAKIKMEVATGYLLEKPFVTATIPAL